MLASWIFGAVVLALMVALHWLAFRVKSSRERAARKRREGGAASERMSQEPLTPK